MADVTDLPIKVVGGRQYYYYQVKPKETIYSLTRQLNVSKSDIFRFNPAAEDGLKAGQELLFPVDGVASYTKATGEYSAPLTHTVSKGETLFGISRRYNVTTDQLMAWNPLTRDGLKSGMVIYVSAPSSAPQIEQPITGDGMRYVIQSGETLYQIAHNHGTTVDAIVALNPGLDSNHYSAGQTIALPVASVSHSSTAAPSIQPSQMPMTAQSPRSNNAGNNVERYVVQEGETLYSIARKHGVSVESLEAANPSLGILKRGMTLVIPPSDGLGTMAVQVTPVDRQTEVLPPPGAQVLPMPAYPSPGEVIIPAEPVKIAVALPFMTATSEKSKSSQLFAEFYRGFMLAVDSLRKDERPVHVYAFDTHDRVDSVRNLLSRPEMKEMSILIAPDDEEQLKEFAFFGRTNNVPVINTFVVKDNSYRYNPAIVQCNIPHHDMYTKAIKELTREFLGATPVILNSEDGADDKAEYIALLRQQLDSMNVRYLTIDYKSRLSFDALKSLTKGHNYVFIPTSGKQSEFAKIAPALISLQEQMGTPDAVRVFGYPEWITFRGESQKQLHELNTSIYSRFYSNPDDVRVKEINELYKKWYGSEMGNFLPSQGLLGFDMGMFVIESLRAPSVALDSPGAVSVDNGMKIYDGVQNSFHIVRVPNAGAVNDMLYIITFRPSGIIEHRSI